MHNTLSPVALALLNADALRACTGSVRVTVTDGPVTATSFHPSTPVADRLAFVWGSEWDRLSPADQALIVRDCTEEGGVTDYEQYRRDIFPGNLQSYAKTQRVRRWKA